MKRTFINQEARKSTVILIGVLALFLILQVSMHYGNIKEQKSNYTEIIGSIAAKSIYLVPEYENEIISLITSDITDTDRANGRRLLQEYGIMEELDLNIFPNLIENANMVVLSIFVSCVLFILNYMQYSKVFAKIRNLTVAAQKILDQDYIYCINESMEGDVSKLAVEFSNIRRVIQHNLEQIQIEKQHLVEFLQNISHQFKTKLTTMMLYNDILLTRKITEEQRIQFLKDNAIQLKNMNSVIQRVLKLAKLDAKVVEYNKKAGRLDVLMQNVSDNLRELANIRGVHVEIESRVNIVLPYDRFWLEEAFENILKNCIEHTSAGGAVTIDITSSPLFDRVIIKDTGEGIDRIDLTNIFNRFYISKISKKKDSVGIGLSIAKSIIEAHNGYIDVMSKKEEGTSFIVTFVNEDR